MACFSDGAWPCECEWALMPLVAGWHTVHNPAAVRLDAWRVVEKRAASLLVVPHIGRVCASQLRLSDGTPGKEEEGGGLCLLPAAALCVRPS
jgi:hypothetical protein